MYWDKEQRLINRYVEKEAIKGNIYIKKQKRNENYHVINYQNKPKQLK